MHGSGKTTLLKSKKFSGKCDVKKKYLRVTSIHIFSEKHNMKKYIFMSEIFYHLLQNIKDIVLF